MIKKSFYSTFFLLVCGLFFATKALSQGGMWIWVSGSNIPDDPGVFGTKGVASVDNMPPSVYEACEWTDTSGIFWLYGGVAGAFGAEYDDLWKYDPADNTWTWMNGSGTGGTLPNYGTQGVPSPSNNPGGLGWGVMTWVDNDNNLWLFGGNSPSLGGSTNDLWKYSIVDNMWTWMRGSAAPGSPASYGTKGVSGPTNDPPSMAENNTTWTDDNNNLWLYGGWGDGGVYDDLWKYDVSINEWTWVSGTGVPDSPANYGVKKIESPSNTPGGRFAYSKFKNGEKLYLFGAGSLDDNSFLSIGNLNDLWSYNLTTGNWTWESGTSNLSDPGNAGAVCQEDSLFVPSPKYEQRASWNDGSCGLWIFGGFDGNFLDFSAYNDLFYYNLQTEKWALVSGSATANGVANYGIKGEAAFTNNPGARGGALPFKGKDGSIWLFGGASMDPSLNFEMRNDLWQFIPDTSCIKICDKNNLPPVVEIPLAIPNVISLNGDGVNDVFYIRGLKPKTKLEVYNRWGKVIYAMDEYQNDWEAKDEFGRKAIDGVYYYILTPAEGNPKTGFLHVVE